MINTNKLLDSILLLVFGAIVANHLLVSPLSALPLIETVGRPNSDSTGFYPSTGPLPVVSDRFGNGDAYSLPVAYRRGEFRDGAFLNLSPGTTHRSRWFDDNRLVRATTPVGEAATKWIVDADRGAPTGIRIEWPIIRRPESIQFTIHNQSEHAARLRPILTEVGTTRKWPGVSWKLSEITLKAGEEKDVVLPLVDLVSRNADRLADRGYDNICYPAVFGLDLVGVKKVDNYRLLFSNYSVNYGHAYGVIVQELEVDSEVKVDVDCRISIKVEGVQSGDIVDIEIARKGRTLFRDRLGEKTVHELSNVGHAHASCVFPDFLSEGEYEVIIVVNGYRAEQPKTSFVLSNSRKSDLPQVEIKHHLGREAIFVDGNYEPWIGHASINLQPADISTFAGAEADFIIETAVGVGTTMSDEPSWNGIDSPDYSALDQKVTMVLAQRPNAKLVIRSNLTMPPAWAENNPELISRVRDIKGTEAAVEVHGIPQPAFAAEAWRQEQEKLLRRLVRHVRQQPWASQVIGFWLAARPHEWFFCGNKEEFWDYSSASQKEFRNWARNQKVLRDIDADTLEIPSPEIRKHSGKDFHDDTIEGRKVAAYNQFESWLNAETIIHFAKAVKDETDGRSLVGCHYGYLFVLSDTINQGRGRILSSLTKVLDSPEIDFVAGVIVPKHWGLDSHDLYSLPFEATRLRGKHYMLSNDHTFHLTPGVGKPWGDPVFDPDDPEKGDRYMQQRIIANAAIHGVSPHWFGLRPTWWGDEVTTHTISKMANVYREAASANTESIDEVALVIDHTGYDWLQDEARFLRNNGYLLYRALQRTGAPVSTWLLSDIDKLPERIRFVVVGFAAAPSQEDLAKLENLIAKGGRTISVIGRPGVIDTETGKWNPEKPSEILGLPIRVLSNNEKFATVPVGEMAELAAREGASVYNSKDTWVGMGIPTNNQLTDARLAPQPRAVVDEADTIIYQNGDGAFASRELKHEGRLIWCSIAPINSAIWREWMHEAGVHFYAPLHYFVHASQELVSITAPTDGEVGVLFPCEVTVVDLFDELTSASGSELTIPFERGQTRLFRVDLKK